jgi:glycosyltransferase involved in cell wall biosynthesis
MTEAPKLKILFCILYYLPHRTGMPIYIQRIGQELIRRGHEVTVLAAQHKPELPAEEIIDGIRVRRVYAPPIPISRGMLMPAYAWVLYEELRKHDVVNVHTPMLETALISIVAQLANRPVIVTHHGDLILPAGITNRVIQSVMYWLYWFTMQRSPKLVMYSQDYAQNSYYAAPFMDKLETVYPPIAIPTPNPQRVAQLRAEWSPNGGPIIGFAGRFVEEKRPDLLIRALDVINQQHPNVRVVFAGQYDIPYENTWERYQPLVEQYKGQLIFLGLIDDAQTLADFYAACDVLALTSDTECFALVQVEAMLCGTPVMMTDIPGGRVPVQVTGMGKHAQAGDAVAIGETLLEIINQRDQYVRPRAEIEACFSLKETVDRYEQLFSRYADR